MEGVVVGSKPTVLAYNLAILKNEKVTELPYKYFGSFRQFFIFVPRVWYVRG